MQTISLEKIRFNSHENKNGCKFGIGRFGDSGHGTNETFQLFSLHRTEDGAVKRLRRIKGIGHLQIVNIVK